MNSPDRIIVETEDDIVIIKTEGANRIPKARYVPLLDKKLQRAVKRAEWLQKAQAKNQGKS